VRKVLAATVLLATAPLLNAQSQPSLSDRVHQSFDFNHQILVTPEIAKEIPVAGQLSKDYFGEVSNFLKSSPDVPYLCAVLTLARGQTVQIPLTGAEELRKKELNFCKAYPATKEQIAEVQKWYFPPTPPRRQQIAQRLKWNLEANTRKWGRVYYPPPISPKDWQDGNVAGHDYRADLQSDFDQNPLLVVQICNVGKAAPSPNPRIAEFENIFDAVCTAFSDAKIETAFRVYRAEEGKAWLTGLLNSSLDEAASLTPDLRRQKTDSLVRDLPRMAASGTSRLENAVRAVALAPGDFRAVTAVLKYAPEGNWSSQGAEPADVVNWISNVYAQRSLAGKDQSEWRRGQRALFVMTGQLEKARTAAQQILAENDAEKHSLDVIYLAAIERSLGNASSYDRLMIDCPAPDALYVREHGKPARAERYCEDVLAEFARTAREQLRGNPAETAFAQIARDTNRVDPALVTALAAPPIVPPSPDGQTDDWFSAVIKTQEERVAKMTNVQRETVGDEAMDPDAAFGKSIGFEKAVYSQLLRPWHEGNAAILLNEVHALSYSSTYDKRERVLKLVSEWFEKRAASDPEANEWKRGLRGFLLFRGDYVRARDLSRQLSAESDPKFATRDRMLLGLTERILGNRKPLDEAMAACPGPSKEDLENYGESSNPRHTDACQSLLIWDIERAITVSEQKLPNAYKEILVEFGSEKEAASELRAFAIRHLERIDIDLADKQWRDLLIDPKCLECVAQKAYMGLARIAEQKKRWNDGIFWIDRYISSLGYLHSFRPEMWKWFADLPEGTWGTRSNLTETYDMRIRLALAANDYENARRSVEDMLGFADDCRCGMTPVRLALIKIATDEISKGQRQEPLRILGYLSRQPLSAYFIAQVDDLRKKLGAEPKREDSPWDSPARMRPKPPIPQPTPTSVSKT
jgi:hypothetical protein